MMTAAALRHRRQSASSLRRGVPVSVPAGSGRCRAPDRRLSRAGHAAPRRQSRRPATEQGSCARGTIRRCRMPEESQKAVLVMSAMTTATPGRNAASSSTPNNAALLISTSGGNTTISGTTKADGAVGGMQSHPHRNASARPADLAPTSCSHEREASRGPGLQHDCVLLKPALSRSGTSADGEPGPDAPLISRLIVLLRVG